MEDGRMVTKDGHLVKPKYVAMKPDTQRLWNNLYFGFKRKGVDRTFNQLAGFFAHEYGYHPPKDLDFMPKESSDWYRKIVDVPANRLSGKEAA
jgi:hypothetical protein